MSEPSIGTATVPASSAQLHRASAWIYSGVWAALTGLFLVPREPPTMPEGSHEIIGTFRPSANYLKYIKVFFWISLFSFNIPIWIGWIGITIAAPIVGIILAVLAIGLLSVQGVFGYIGIHLRYDSTWYVLTDRSMRLRRGVLHLSETTITYENVQNVTVEQGPLQRFFGIADVAVLTAGGGGHHHGGKGDGGNHLGRIEGVDNAHQIRDLIMTRVRASRSAGLGDDQHTHEVKDPHQRPGKNAVWTPAHLAALREIRSLLPAR